MTIYPKAVAPSTEETARLANERADRWESRYTDAKVTLTSVWAMAERASRKGYELDPDEVLALIDGTSA